MIIQNGHISAPPKTDAQVMEVARKFEASFLAEMLRYSGIGATPESFGGGAGETQFAPLLADHYAAALVDAGGIGLAERVAATLLYTGETHEG